MGQPLSVLILEDNPVDMFLIKKRIKQHQADHTIIEANNYEQAFEALSEYSIDIIFSDLKIPIKTGMDFVVDVLNLNNANSDIPIVVCTNAKEDGMLKLTLQDAVYRYLQKPVTKEEVAEAINSSFK